MTVTVATLGFPRIGPRRELKTALERYWAGKTDAAALLANAAELRAATWTRQKALGAVGVVEASVANVSPYRPNFWNLIRWGIRASEPRRRFLSSS